MKLSLSIIMLAEFMNVESVALAGELHQKSLKRGPLIEWNIFQSGCASFSDFGKHLDLPIVEEKHPAHARFLHTLIGLLNCSKLVLNRPDRGTESTLSDFSFACNSEAMNEPSPKGGADNSNEGCNDWYDNRVVWAVYGSRIQNAVHAHAAVFSLFVTKGNPLRATTQACA
jgi:hypothetical protein